MAQNTSYRATIIRTSYSKCYVWKKNTTLKCVLTKLIKNIKHKMERKTTFSTESDIIKTNITKLKN